MQASLQQATPPPSSSSPTAHQPFSGSAWSTQPWLMAAAAVSTVVLISVAVWQRSQIAQLRQTVSQLTRPQTTQPLPTSPDALPFPGSQATNGQPEAVAGPLKESASRSQNTPNQPDTVYVTRYVTVPDRLPQTAAGERSLNRRDERDMPVPEQNRSLADQQQKRATRSTRPDQDTDVASTELPDKENTATEPAAKPDVARVPNRRSETAETVSDEAGKLSTPSEPVTNETSRMPVSKSRSARRLNEKEGRPLKSTPLDGVASRRKRGPTAGSDLNLDGQVTSGTTTNPNRATDEPAPEVPSDATTGLPAATYELTTSRPVTMGRVDWDRALAVRARRMRPARTAVVSGIAPTVTRVEPESQPASKVALGFRLGAGMEVTKAVLSGDIRGELLIGSHFTLGAGLGMARYEGGTFRNEIEFNHDNRRDFRRDFASVLDRRPIKNIKDISTHTERLQVPLTLGYRIPVSKTLSVLPSIGTTLNLQSREMIAFTHFEPFLGFAETTGLISRPVALLNSFTLGAGIEWHHRHWVAQAGPMLAIAATRDFHWQQGKSAGLRARLFYQF